MVDNEIIALLRLQIMPNIGCVTAKKLIAHCGRPTAVFTVKKDDLLAIEGIGSYCLTELHQLQYKVAAEQEWHYIQRNKITVYSYLDQDYPELLKHCADGPLLLFARGTFTWNSNKIISVVGTRQCTERGRLFCKKLVEDLVPYNPLIISGMAYGIDICVQRAAYDLGLQTIGCLAHGLDRLYPPSHKGLASKIEANGAMITEFWSGTLPERNNFLRRNRIIAGLSQATLVVESAITGGSLVTADMAFGYNRDVFAVPGRPGDLFSEGCNGLIKNHKAQLVTSATDIIQMLGWNTEHKSKPGIQGHLFPELQPDEEKVYSYLKTVGKCYLDDLAKGCSLSVNKTASTLMILEMKGMVKPVPGKYFEVL